MAGGPIEFRYFLRQYTLEDIHRGLQPVKMEPGHIFAPPVLQFRYRERISNGDATTMQWSEWRDVPYVREGDEDFHVGAIPVTAETVRQ